MRIVLTGGGTGGHIYPLVAVSREIKNRYGSDVEFLFIGPNGEMEKRAMDEESIKSKKILAGKMRRYFSPGNFTDFFKVPIGIIQSLVLLLVYMPDVVFSKGGYASFPVVFAAWVYRIPILTHESDSIPGLANRIIGKFSNRVAISYPRSRRYFDSSKTLLSGNPIRKQIVSGDAGRVIQKLGLAESRPVILVLGGSLGSENVNKAVIKILPELLKYAQVIHQTGEVNYENVIRTAAVEGVKAGRGGYYPIDFLSSEDMSDSLAVATLVISRAGANSISEIAANSKPAILIPLASAANNHQSMNAFALAEVGGAIVLEESNLGEHILMQKVQKILDEQDFRENLAENIKPFYNPEATSQIVDGIVDLIK
ncbi:undecaprenyldiphospho-muramoylpentapeptide beta-N-acetylglucosaminyltransferase [Patescibacteria group bacterium]